MKVICICPKCKKEYGLSNFSFKDNVVRCKGCGETFDKVLLKARCGFSLRKS